MLNFSKPFFIRKSRSTFVSTKQGTMLQRSEIGKKRSKKSQAQAMLNRICITPKGNKYSLVEFEKIGNTYHWTYEWLDCPTDVLDVTTNRVKSKSQLGLAEIMTWMDELRSLID